MSVGVKIVVGAGHVLLLAIMARASLSVSAGLLHFCCSSQIIAARGALLGFSQHRPEFARLSKPFLSLLYRQRHHQSRRQAPGRTRTGWEGGATAGFPQPAPGGLVAPVSELGATEPASFSASFCRTRGGAPSAMSAWWIALWALCMLLCAFNSPCI